MGQWQPGKELKNGKYVIEEMLGEGGFGTTYKIKDQQNGEKFALKTLNSRIQNQPDFNQQQEKFINEAIILASCNHPNIVRIYPQSFQEEGLWCMVMEYISGQNLAEYLESNGILAEEKAIEIIIKISQALDFVHQKGVLHRDIKPDNILLCQSDNSPVLIDFGIAREYIPGKIKILTSVRTEHYAPIEQYERKSDFGVGAWTDIYAIAATLYVLLTLELPLPSRYRKDLPLTPPQKHNSQISDRINEAIVKGMEYEPKNRPQSIPEWLQLIQPSIEWEAGVILSNRPYQIEKVIGSGAYEITYKAKDIQLNTSIVIKTPNSTRQQDPNYQELVNLFRREAQILARLSQKPHSHLVRIIQLFEENGLPCMVMDFIEGESLDTLVQRKGRIPETEAIKYIKQIGSALRECHQAGIVHRDVHPNNIIIRKDDGQAVLIDFGISGNIKTDSMTAGRGNIAFAPWEQINSSQETSSKTPQVDIYTLAASLYYLVTGDTPTPALARKYDDEELEAPKQLNANLSDRINEAIIKGLEIEPENRPQTMEEWLEMLKPERSPQPPIPPPSAPPLKREVRGAKSENPLVRGAKSQNFLDWDLERKHPSSVSRSESVHPPSVREAESKHPPSLRGAGGDLFKFEVVTVDRSGRIVKKEPRKAEYFSEDLGNGITLEMVAIPGGTFMMGAPESEKYSSDNERPQHQVKVPPFYLGKYQVTQGQWKAVAALPKIERDLKPDPSIFKGNNRPVESVSWYEAVEFCKRLSKATGKEYRLPSEAEWEYATRGGTTTPFHFGETITTDLANYDGNYTYGNEPKGKYREETTPVGSFPPNEFGLYDMHGNVWEWCADTWHENYQGAPKDGSVWLGGSNNDNRYHVLRGGSWNHDPLNCRSARRNRYGPDDINGNNGFRCLLARTL